jgi:hypothetical protein
LAEANGEGAIFEAVGLGEWLGRFAGFWQKLNENIGGDNGLVLGVDKQTGDNILAGVVGAVAGLGCLCGADGG